jgi:hypothetical protein
MGGSRETNTRICYAGVLSAIAVAGCQNNETELSQEAAGSITVLWQSPQAGDIKCNVDNAIYNDLQQFGVGMCIQDRQGQFLKTNTSWFDGILSQCKWKHVDSEKSLLS